MLFQSTTTIGGVTIKNMTNDAASDRAINAIAASLKSSGVDHVELVCTHSGDENGPNASCFAVWGSGDFLFHVCNDGVIY